MSREMKEIVKLLDAEINKSYREFKRFKARNLNGLAQKKEVRIIELDKARDLLVGIPYGMMEC